MSENTKANKEKNGGFIKNSWKNHKALSIICLVIVLLTVYRVGLYFGKPAQDDAADMVNVKIEHARVEPISLTAPLTGRIQPVEDVAIVPLAQGQVTAVHVSVGDKVSKGDILFELDKSAVSAQYNSAKQAYDAVAASYERVKLLYNEGAISRQDFEATETQYIAQRETFNAAATMYSYYNVTSPIDGYVTSMNVSVGSVAGQSMAASVANVDELIIDTTVSEALAGSVQVGKNVDVYVASLGETFKGTVKSFSPIPSLGTLTYPLTITMDNSSGKLFAGMFAEVHMVSDQVQAALCISSESVIIKSGESVVVVLDKDDDKDIPRIVPVKTGIDNGEKVEIVSGLSEGDTVVCSGQQYVTEGVAVNIVGE